MFCEKCGFKSSDTDVFCKKCGIKLDSKVEDNHVSNQLITPITNKSIVKSKNHDKTLIKIISFIIILAIIGIFIYWLINNNANKINNNDEIFNAQNNFLSENTNYDMNEEFNTENSIENEPMPVEDVNVSASLVFPNELIFNNDNNPITNWIDTRTKGLYDTFGPPNNNDEINYETERAYFEYDDVTFIRYNKLDAIEAIYFTDPLLLSYNGETLNKTPDELRQIIGNEITNESVDKALEVEGYDVSFYLDNHYILTFISDDIYSEANEVLLWSMPETDYFYLNGDEIIATIQVIEYPEGIFFRGNDFATWILGFFGNSYDNELAVFGTPTTGTPVDDSTNFGNPYLGYDGINLNFDENFLLYNITSFNPEKFYYHNEPLMETRDTLNTILGTPVFDNWINLSYGQEYWVVYKVENHEEDYYLTFVFSNESSLPSKLDISTELPNPILDKVIF